MTETTSQAQPLVSVVIPTRNRWAEVQQAVDSCLSQDYPALEISVYDDASEENIAQKLQDKYPTIKVSRRDAHVGQIVLRNQGFREAAGRYVFSLDDDAFFNDHRTISKIVEKFEKYQNVAVIALPYYEPKNKKMCWQGLDGNNNKLLNDKLIANFVACAAAFRKEAFVKMNGFRELYFFQGEEDDLSIRLLEHGYDIIASHVTPLTHTFSMIRDFRTLHIIGPRNAILFNFINVPLLYLFPRLLLNTLGIVWHGIAIKEPWLKITGILKGYGACLKYRRQRRPVSPQVWRRYRRLLKNPQDYPAKA
jgi:glycosyltransferase involved in cell wall biosynthesis